MSQRTFALVGTGTDAGGTPLANAPCSFQVLLPGVSGALIDGNGAFVSMAPVPFRLLADGTVPTAPAVTVDYPGDYQSAYRNAQIRLTINGVAYDSPIGFGYAATIAITDWINVSVATGLVTMRAVYTKDDGTPIPGAIGSVVLSDSAVVTASGAIRSANNPVQSAAASDGTMTFSLDPNSALNPSDLGYRLTIGGEARPWEFEAPAIVDVYRGAWNSATAYTAASGPSHGDVVTEGGVLYRCILAHTNQTPPNATYWQVVSGLPTDLITANLTLIGPSNGTIIGTTGVAASPTLTAVAGDPVNPAASLDDNLVDLAWRDTQRLRWLGAWSGATAYLANDVVSDSGADYICILAHTNHEPPNGTYWTALAGSSGGTPITTEGDLIVGNGSGAAARLPLGLPNQFPSPVGPDVAWLTPVDASGLVDPTTTDGDLLFRKKTTITSLAIGWIGDSWLTQTPSGSTIPTLVAGVLNAATGLTITTSNQGISGTSTSDWFPAGANYLAAVAAFAGAGTRLVVIALGVNDGRVAVRNSAATYQANLQSIVNDLVGRGYLVAVCYPSFCVPGSNAGDQDATANTLRLAYQAKINQIVNGGTVRQGDTSVFAYFQNNPSALSDGIHPTAAAQATVATLWAAGISRVVSALTQLTTLQRLTLGTNLSISGTVLNVSGAPSTHYEPVVLANPGGTAPTFIVNSNGQVVMTPIAN